MRDKENCSILYALARCCGKAFVICKQINIFVSSCNQFLSWDIGIILYKNDTILNILFEYVRKIEI